MTQILPARRRTLVGVALLWLVPGWAGETNPPATDAQTLPRAVADASESGFMLAEESYLTSTRFFIKYRVGDECPLSAKSGHSGRAQNRQKETRRSGFLMSIAPESVP
ncbi:MAG: hypothetical protein O6763_10495 [Gammaproteobacteria bacterium]|nr:hypothetical protein [Gammaproteobacteria bacterium]